MSRASNRSPKFARTLRSVIFLMFLISFAMVAALWRTGWTARARGFPSHVAQTLGVESPSKTNTVNATVSCVAPPSGMVLWLPGDGNAHDIRGENNGTLMNGVTFNSGEVGQAFHFNGTAQFVQTTNATLGNYPDTSVPLSTDTTVAPDALPINTTSINVSASNNFKGTLEGDPTTGVVRVTDAHPAGTYTVTVTAFDSGGATTTKTFTLTVTTPATCNPVSFAAAANFGAGSGPRSVAVGDFNGDDKQDLAVANQNSANVSILLGDGAGSFGAATNFGVGATPL